MTAGLSAILYVAGAASLWLALKDRGYSPDVGIEHEPRSVIIGLGLRGALVIGGFTLVAFPIGTVLASALRIGARGRARVVGANAAAIVVLIGAAFSWRLLAVAVAASALMLVIAFRAGETENTRWLWLLLAIAATMSSLSWLYGSPVRSTSVSVRPKYLAPIEGQLFRAIGCTPNGKPAHSLYAHIRGKNVWLAEKNGCNRQPEEPRAQILGFLRNCTVPYFGQTDSFVYLGAIRDVTRDRSGTCNWDAGPIVELRRDKVRLRFSKGKAFLGQSTSRPIAVAWHALESFIDKL